MTFLAWLVCVVIATAAVLVLTSEFRRPPYA